MLFRSNLKLREQFLLIHHLSKTRNFTNVSFLEDFCYFFAILLSQKKNQFEYANFKRFFSFSLFDSAILQENKESLANFSIFSKGLFNLICSKKNLLPPDSNYDFEGFSSVIPSLGVSYEIVSKNLEKNQILIDYIKCNSLPDKSGFSNLSYFAIVYNSSTTNKIDVV